MTVGNVISRAISAIKGPSVKNGSVIHLALSGGVDSSVSAFLLRERGWDVRPVLMRCWAGEEEGADASCFESEVRASENALRALKLQRSLSVFDLVSEYWSEVFDGVLLSGLSKGITPNQDLACNRKIKFGVFLKRLADEAGTSNPPPFATGHYAQVANEHIDHIKLLRAVDDVKDQTYFLASVHASALDSAVFPVGSLLKSDVRRIASHIALPAANETSSRGICFIGKRKMASFMTNYLAPPVEIGAEVPKEALHANEDTKAQEPGFVLEGRRIGRLPQSIHLYTVGQRARFGGLPNRLFVAEKDGTDVVLQPHPPTTRRVVCSAPHWISASAMDVLAGSQRDLQYKGNSTACLSSCEARLRPCGGLEVEFKSERPAVAPGQAMVFYSGPEVLGSAIVDYSIISGLHG